MCQNIFIIWIKSIMCYDHVIFVLWELIRFSADFRENRSQVICSNLLHIIKRNLETVSYQQLSLKLQVHSEYFELGKRKFRTCSEQFISRVLITNTLNILSFKYYQNIFLKCLCNLTTFELKKFIYLFKQREFMN